jgi:hypothetical protein
MKYALGNPGNKWEGNVKMDIKQSLRKKCGLYVSDSELSKGRGQGLGNVVIKQQVP